MPAPAQPSHALQVSAAGFTGTLDELAQALRNRQVQPDTVPLLDITRQVIDRAQALEPSERAEALPPLASVIALKARLLLPQPEMQPSDDDWEDIADEGYDDVLRGIEALAELDELVGFLSRRRAERVGLIAARPLPLNLPRKQRPAAGKAGLAKLLRAAQNAVREVPAPLLARERLTLQGALEALKAFGQRLRHFTLLGVPASGWNERSTYFAALLEGVKEGLFSAEQPEPFADIEIVALQEDDH